MGLGQRFLQHVGRVDAGRKPPIQPQRDHCPQPITMELQQLLRSRLVAGRGLLEERVVLFIPWLSHWPRSTLKGRAIHR